MSKLVALSVAAVVVAFQGLVFVPATYATKSDKVTICHATNAQKNPYVRITVNSSSIVEQNHGTPNGHGTHEGGVWTKGAAAHSWGDIIPPFESPVGTKYAGMNWTDQGQAIYNKGCSMVAATQDTDGSGDKTQAEGTDEVTTPSADTTESAATTPGEGGATPASELPHTGPVASATVMGSLLSGATYFATRKLQKK